ncbi:MAG: GAD domain-containing protein, partial [Promethearchaeota archaeon]
EGTRVEIKGVQKLDWIPLLINHEISRQLKLVEIKDELEKRGLKKDTAIQKPKDLTKALSNTKSNFISKGIKSGKKLYGINFSGFKGIFGKELMEDYRFGTEVSSKVKSISGLKGIIHSDEDLKNYKLSNEDIDKINNQLNSDENDCFVLVLGTQNEVDKAIKVIVKRGKYSFEGVPPETRRALENGNTEFLRELHGGARLYPDTDSQAIINSEAEINNIKKKLPKYPWDVIKDYSSKYEIEERLIKELIFTGNLDLFNDLLNIYPENPTLIITTLLETIIALRRDGKKVENISEIDYKDIFTLLKNNEIGKEAIEEFLSSKSDNPNLSIKDIKKELKIEKISEKDLKKIITKVVDENIASLK